MKVISVLFLSFPLIFMSSCNADQTTVDKMADEMCKTMAKYDEDKPKAVYNAASNMLDIISKEEEYGSVSESQLKKTMKKKCPEGYEKFIKLINEEK